MRASLMVAALLLGGLAQAEPLVFEAEQLSAIQLNGMAAPAITDVSALDRDLAAALEDLRALERMVAMLDDARGRAALSGQLKTLSGRLSGAQARLKQGAHAVKLTEAPKPAMRLVPRPCPPCARVPLYPRKPEIKAMPEEDFKIFLAALKKLPYSKDRLGMLRSTAEERRFDIPQARKIAKVFEYSKDRVKAMVLIYPRLTAPEDVFQLYDVFDYSSDREKFQKKVDAIKEKQREAARARKGKKVRPRHKGKRDKHSEHRHP